MVRQAVPIAVRTAGEPNDTRLVGTLVCRIQYPISVAVGRCGWGLGGWRHFKRRFTFPLAYGAGNTDAVNKVSIEISGYGKPELCLHQEVYILMIELQASCRSGIGTVFTSVSIDTQIRLNVRMYHGRPAQQAGTGCDIKTHEKRFFSAIARTLQALAGERSMEAAYPIEVPACSLKVAEAYTRIKASGCVLVPCKIVRQEMDP